MGHFSNGSGVWQCGGVCVIVGHEECHWEAEWHGTEWTSDHHHWGSWARERWTSQAQVTSPGCAFMLSLAVKMVWLISQNGCSTTVAFDFGDGFDDPSLGLHRSHFWRDSRFSALLYRILPYPCRDASCPNFSVTLKCAVISLRNGIFV